MLYTLGRWDGWMDGEMYVWDGAGWDGVRWMEWDRMDGWLKEGEGCGRMAYGGWDGMWCDVMEWRVVDGWGTGWAWAGLEPPTSDAPSS